MPTCVPAALGTVLCGPVGALCFPIILLIIIFLDVFIYYFFFLQ